MNFDDILEKLEADNKILDFKFSKSQIPMYLLVRFILIQALINKEFNLSNPHVKVNKKPLKDIFKYIYHTLKSNIFFAPKKDIYIFSSEIVNKMENGKYVNRLYDEFYNLNKDKTQICELSGKYSYLLPKKEKIYFRDFFHIVISLLLKFKKVKQEDKISIDDFLLYLQNIELKIDEEIIKDLRNRLLELSVKNRVSYFLYMLFFKIKKPKIFILEDAHYLEYIPIIKAAKLLNIITVEYQHGYIGLAHPAYNYHKNIFENIKEYFPEYFLTHGKYWSDRIRIPTKKIEIGLPSLLQNMTISDIKEKIILFISSGTVPDDVNSIINSSYDELVKLDYKVILRPHPSEYEEIEKRYANLSRIGVEIDKNNLYESLSKSEIVVGLEVSTVLFEAVYFTNKVYLMNTKYTSFYEPKNCFISFSSVNELLNFIRNNSNLSYTYEYFWEKNWKSNYNNFIKNLI